MTASTRPRTGAQVNAATAGAGSLPASDGEPAAEHLPAAEEDAATNTSADTPASPEIVAAIAAYTPDLTVRGLDEHAWERVAPLARAVVTAACPANATQARVLMAAAIGLLAWCRAEDVPLRAGTVFRETTIARYARDLPAGSRPTVVSRLRKLVAAAPAAAVRAAAEQPTPAPAATDIAPPLLLRDQPADADALDCLGLASPGRAALFELLAGVRARVLAVHPDALRRQPPARGRGRALPYGDVEVVALMRACAHQRSAKRRLHTLAMLAVGAGAGVVGEEAARLRGTDIATDNGDVSVTVGGDTARVVAVLAPFGPLLARLAAQAGPGWLLGGGPARRNRVSELSAGLADSAPHLVRADSARLRATWLAVHLAAATPLPALLRAAGLAGVTSLDDLLVYVPHTDADLAGRTWGGGPR